MQFANAEDYERALEAMVKARDQWMSVSMGLMVDSDACEGGDCQADWAGFQGEEECAWTSDIAGNGKDPVGGAG